MEGLLTRQKDIIQKLQPVKVNFGKDSAASKTPDYIKIRLESICSPWEESGEFIILRALLDRGSQISLISENAAQLLGLQRHSYYASIAGIGNGASQSRGMVMLKCQSIHDDYQFSTEALVISRVINNLPNVSFNKRSMPAISNIKLADPEYNISRPVDFLLDASVYSAIIMNGLIKNPGQNIIAQQTRVGWILSGNVRTFNCHVVLNNLAEISKYWELEDITTASSVMTPQEQFCEDFYQRTTKRLENGAYMVGIPMRTGFEKKLGSSRPKAVAQFKQVENKLQRKQQLGEQYRQFIKEYQVLGHVCKAELTIEPSCYLPHHSVLRSDTTTTKLRVVFNASAKTSSGHSLNDLMECGPNLQQDLQTLILNWRQFKYVVTADIEKMFRTIFVREADQHLQKIIWRDSVQEPLQEYCLTTVTYGTKAAPFLAMRTLRQLALDDAHLYPLAAVALQSSFYMDDLLTGGNTVQEARELQQQLIKMLSGAGMNLRKWSSNEPQLINTLSQDRIDTPLEFRCSETRRTLGLQWNNLNIISADVGTKPALCQPTVSACADKWDKLHRRNVWLYSCCEECKIRIFCATGAEVKELRGNGIIDIDQGCTLKSETFTIQRQREWRREPVKEPPAEASTASASDSAVKVEKGNIVTSVKRGTAPSTSPRIITITLMNAMKQ